jgi:hypothetical protein
MKRYKRKKGPVRAKKTTVDGLSFASGLEAYMYKALKAANIKAEYEGFTYELIREFDFDIDVYERCANGKGEYKNRGHKKIRKISYTPDFIGDKFIIECKGRPNESFPIRWKLFKKFIANTFPKGSITIYKPQNQKECDKVIELINEKLGN